MTSKSRRDFLKTAGLLTGTAATLSMFPPVIRQALAVPANNATRSIKDVEHVVILMQENRSFDSYFGTFPGVRGFGDRFTIPQASGKTVFEQSNGTRVVMPYYLDQRRGNAQRVSGTPHSWSDAQLAWSSGQINQWPKFKRNQSMGYYTEEELPFQFALANAFTLCDAYHCSLHGGTNPNRLFHWTGTNGPTGAGVAAVVNEWDDLGPSSLGYSWTTYPERLQKAGVSWKVYQNLPENFGDNPLSGFKQYRRASEAVGNGPTGAPYIPWTEAQDKTQPLYKGAGNTMPQSALNTPASNRLVELRADIQAGKLPQVSWVVAPATYSEHPGPSSPVQGAWYIQEVLSALVAKPETWSKTVLIVNFDENDGFFDHVPPPAVHSLNADGSKSGASTLSDQVLAFERFNYPVPPGTTGQPKPDGGVFGPGPRVPCYIVSPWSRGGWVNSQVFDHTSVLQFLEKRFDVHEPNISAHRRAVCGDLTSAFNFLDPNTDVPTLPSSTLSDADKLRADQEALAQVALPLENAQRQPRQTRGKRSSRALPYELHVDATADGAAGKVTLNFRNTGTQGTVFHVYDRLHLDLIPRRYTVEAGKTLAGVWTTAADFGKYDLWVLGPNGFHRHFTGSTASVVAKGTANLEVTSTYDKAAQSLTLHLANSGTGPCTALVKANAYETWTTRVSVAAGQKATVVRPLKLLSNWYDYTVTQEDDALFNRRFAGRLETGQDGVSDPAMGQASSV